MSNLIKFADKLKKKLAQQVIEEQPPAVNPIKDPEMEALYRKLNEQTKTIDLLGTNISHAIYAINRISEEGHAGDKSTSIDLYSAAMNRLQQSLPIIDVAKQQLPGAINTLNQMINVLKKQKEKA